MKKVKIVFDLLVLLLISSLLIIFMFQEDEASISTSNYALNVANWNHKFSKSKIYKQIDTIAKEKQMSVYKVTPSNSSTINKNVYIFGNKKRSPVHTFDIHKQNRILNDKELMKTDMRGSYFIKGSKEDSEVLLSRLHHLGINGELGSMSHYGLFLDFISSSGLSFVLLSILLLYLLYYLHIRTRDFKTYAIQKLNGYNNSNIILGNFKQQLPYWFCLILISVLLTLSFLLLKGYSGHLFLFTTRLLILYLCFLAIITICSLLSYTLMLIVDIPQMIKGKRPYLSVRVVIQASKLIMLVIIAILIVQNFNTYDQFKKIKDTEALWEKMSPYYVLELTSFELKNNEEERLQKKLRELVQRSEADHSALLMRNNNLYHPSKYDYTPENGNVIFLNSKAAHLHKRLEREFPLKKLDPSSLNLILPKSAKSKKQEIIKDYKNWLKFHNGNNRGISYKVAKHPYKIYSFDQRSVNRYNYLNSPLICIVNANELDDDFYYASISQGAYLFKNYDKLKANIHDLKLEHYISGITNYKDSVNKEYQEITFKLVILTLSIIIFSAIIIFTLLFEINQYFEQHKKLILIRKIHGYGLLENYATYIILNFLLVGLVGLLVFLVTSSSLVLFIFVCVIIIQLLMEFVYIKYLENKSTQMIKEY